MPPSLPESGVAGTFIDAAREVLAEGMAKIEHCVNQLDDAGVWWRPAEGQNSIANLMLHLSGNVRQWIIAGVGGAAPDVRDRPREFADRSGRPKAEILGLLRRTVAEADGVLSRLTGDGLTQPRRIQGFETNVLAGGFRHDRPLPRPHPGDHPHDPRPVGGAVRLLLRPAGAGTDLRGRR